RRWKPRRRCSNGNSTRPAERRHGRAAQRATGWSWERYAQCGRTDDAATGATGRRHRAGRTPVLEPVRLQPGTRRPASAPPPRRPLMRQTFTGHGASRGNALGRARMRLSHALEVAEERIAPAAVDAELRRLHTAIDAVRVEIRYMRDRLHGALAHEVGEFLDLHTLLLDDPELLQGLDDLVAKGLYGADYALRLQRDRLAAVFEAMDDAYFRSRVEDIDHVIGRVHAMLHKRAADLQGVAGEILVTDAVAPAELGQLQSQGVMAVVTAGGSALSHSAILARSLHLPLVVGAPLALWQINDGDVLLVDGSTGIVIVEPKASDLRDYRARLREEKRERKQLHRLRREPSRTVDGVDIRLWANAESREDVTGAHA